MSTKANIFYFSLVLKCGENRNHGKLEPIQTGSCMFMDHVNWSMGLGLAS